MRFSHQFLEKFQKRLLPHFEDECWSIDVVGENSLSSYNEMLKFGLTINNFSMKYA